MTGKKRKKSFNKNVHKDAFGNILHTGEGTRPNGTYYFNWYENGKRNYIYAPTLKELRTKEQEVEQLRKDGLSTSGINTTVNHCFERWLATTRGKKSTTKDDYEYNYKHYAAESLGNRQVRTLTYTDVKSFFNTMADKGLTYNTIKAVHTVIHQVLEQAKRDRYIPFNPSDGALDGLKKDIGHRTKETIALTVEQVELLFSLMANEERLQVHLYACILMAETGMRIGEVEALCWSQVDFECGEIHVEATLKTPRPKNGQTRKRQLKDPKTTTSTRTIPLTVKAKETLLKAKAYQESKGKKCTKPISGKTDFVFLGERNTPLREDSLLKALKRITQKYNATVTDESQKLPHIKNHTLRHTFATLANEKGMNLKAIQQVMGHSSMETTINTYTHASSEFVKNEMARMEPVQSVTANLTSNHAETAVHSGNIIHLFGDNCAFQRYIQAKI